VFGPDRNCALFNLEFERARIVKAIYRCTTCVTLVAFCEHLSELVVGMPTEHALSLEAEYLLRYHREVPAGRRDRALLAVNALKIAIQCSLQRSER
jgi:NifU-like protein involved in Fe-S cluster formation